MRLRAGLHTHRLVEYETHELDLDGACIKSKTPKAQVVNSAIL